ncbi:hypothetical protein [Pseudoxanthomonas sp.]|uniref:hypothetical protein n=1 Tax=Pseudoxanthomonas sp. TaxID=1871049 RepID=UPI002614EAE5|nr:hypothetical protein [Pseudoxanthomonas sp.]WDS37557.1 MAG: hypothetical protein O8I58_06725 [Pseudoxanthomonas sp.]
MHHARQHPQIQAAERRRRIAHEAARLIAESGIHDYQLAKRKAASRLGIHDDASLPRNQDIEEALRQHQRLFAGPAHADLLRSRREAALQAMTFFSGFSPRLVGPVLDGTADARSPVQLHLHSDDEEAVARFLEDHRIPADARVHRLRMDRERSADVTVWGFVADGMNFDLVVLPHMALRQAPLSPVDEQPMARASTSQLATLLAGT